jgi:hypothetical protein
MRSFTLSSAGITVNPSSTTFTPLCVSPRDAPTPPVSSIYPQNHHNTFVSTQPHISTTTPINHSFFSIDDHSPSLSQTSKSRVNQAIQSGWAQTTIKRYSGSIRRFIRFCDDEGIPDHLRFPADEFVLCAFAASSVGKHTRGTARSYLSALKAWHIAHNMEWRGSTRLRYVLNGVHRLAPNGSRLAPRPPVTAKMVLQLVQHLDPNSPMDIAVAACAVTAFWGQCRLGELLPSSTSVLLSTPFPTRLDFRKSLRNPHSRILHLPRTKTHHDGEDIILVDQRAAINPISLLERHLQVNNVPDNCHIFAYPSGDGWTSLTKSTFLLRCNTIWQTLGYPRTTGHCFRIGGTTELLIAGIPPEVVKATGRWSSDSFLRYWRSLDDIAPRYIRNIHTPRCRRRRV